MNDQAALRDMKKLLPDQKAWLVRKAKLHAQRKLNEIAKRKARRKSEKLDGASIEATDEPKRLMRLVAPEILDFSDNRDHTVEFINMISNLTLKRKRVAFINLSKTSQISAPVAMVLAAEIERCTSWMPGCVNGIDPRDPPVRRLLYEVGFHNHLKFRRPDLIDTEPADLELRYIQMVSGKLNAPHLVERIQEIIAEKDSDGGTDRPRLRDVVSRVVGEAMLNVNQHAYSTEHETSLPRSRNSDWWLAGFRSRDGSVGVIFYDQGVGIPRTMPLNWPKAILEDVVGAISLLSSEERDASLIRAAMAVGKTRLAKDQGRGLGLNDLKLLAQIADKGELRILSRHGEYIYSHVAGTDAEKSASYRSDLRGTLVVWTWAINA